MSLPNDKPSKAQRQFLILLGQDNPPEKPDYFAKGCKVDLCVGCAFESDEGFTSSVKGALAILKEIDI